jgi:hypothetical protein
MKSIREHRRGLNAIELVVVILVVAILAGVMLVVLRNARDEMAIPEAAERTRTFNNLKQVVLACHAASDVFKRIPPAFDQYGEMKFPASVHVHLLPYIEQDNLYKMFLEKKENGEFPNNVPVRTFICPLDFTQTKAGKGVQNLAANIRVFSDKGMATNFDANMPALAGIEPGKATIPTGLMPGSISDGTSNTIFFTLKYSNCQDGGSRYVAAPDSKFAAFFGQNAATIPAHPSDPRATFQDQPTAEQCLISPLMAQSMTKSGLQVGLGDGSVRIINLSISPRTWNLAVQPNDGMELGNDW